MKIKQWITPGRVVYALIAAAPFIIGAAVYSRMPEQMPIHWNGAGEPDNYASKAFALLGLPAFILALNVFVQVVIAHDPKREGLRHAKAMLCLVTVSYTHLLKKGLVRHKGDDHFAADAAKPAFFRLLGDWHFVPTPGKASCWPSTVASISQLTL